MTRVRLIMLSMLAAFAMSAIAATSAQAKHAVFGPYWKTELRLDAGVSRLFAGHNEPIEAAAEGNQVLTAGTRKITCEQLKLGPVIGNSFAELDGSRGENPGRSAEVVEYTGCTVTKNGTPCNVTEPIKTEPLEDNEGYAEKTTGADPEGKGKILTIFEPEAGGTVFATVNFTGAGCEVTTTKVETKAGCTPKCKGIIGEDLNNAKNPVEANTASETAGENGYVRFPATEIKTIFEESHGVVFGELKGGLSAFGVAAKLEGTTKIKLTENALVAEHEEWGVFAK